MYYLSVLLIFKNEEMIIKEWVEHYLWQGVEHFYLIDNGSDDNYLEKIKTFIDNGYITLFNKKEKHKQVQHYNDVFNEIKNDTEWLIVCDVDEYFYGLHTNLKNYIRAIDSKGISCVLSNWNMFGSSGLVKQPESIRKSFIYKSNKGSKFTKYITKTSAVGLLHVHEMHPKSNCKIIIDNENIRLNHYQIMSKEYFEKVKMTKTDVFYIERDTNYRDWNYFKIKDTNDIEDRTLANLIK